MTDSILYNQGWSFVKTPAGTELTGFDAYRGELKPVNVPHDWLIYDTLELYQDGYGWYRNTYDYSPDRADIVKISFDGVYMDSSVYVNGKHAGDWKYGYSSFEFDITGLITEGENEILVLCRHMSPNSRWYSGAGIFRSVHIKEISDPTYICTDGVYASTEKAEGNVWRLLVDTEVEGSVWGMNIVHTLVPHGGDKSERIAGAVLAIDETKLQVPAKIMVNAPNVWDIDTPYLYDLITEIMAGERVIDRTVNVIGFRTIEFTTDKGFFLNGRHVKLNGVCQHHDLGCLGSAVNETALARQLLILKSMGVNSIRTSHNMPSRELMKLADEMGMLIDSEAFDMWERSKTEYDYGRFFKEWSDRDVEAWVRRDRNHPSIIMWSVGNEIYDTHADAHAVDIAKRLHEDVRKYDYRCNGYTTIGSNYMPWEGAQRCACEVDLVGYNYAEKYYAPHHEAHPEWKIYGSETSSTTQSRGIYHFPMSESILADDDEQCSTLGNCTTSWGAPSSEFCIRAERDTEYSAGQYLWSGFDYIGEPTPYHTKNSYFGQIDTAGFPKDTFYIYQAEWTDYRVQPLIHVFPYWDFNEGQIIDVRLSSNCPEVELFLNGESLGRQKIDHAHDEELTKNWRVPYHAGELKAVAYDENGKYLCEEIRRSFGDPASISVTVDPCQEILEHITASDTSYLTFLVIEMKDKDGNIVENASNRVKVEVTGGGFVAGLDNGDSTDYEQYKSTSRCLFSGKLLAVINCSAAGEYDSDEILVKVTSEGLEPAYISLERRAEGYGAEAIPEYITAPVVREEWRIKKEQSPVLVPARKLELSATTTKLSGECREAVVTCRVLPENSNCGELFWMPVTDGGIESNLAKVEPCGNTCKVTAMGDGSFRLRCMTKNGTDRMKIISVLEFTSEGVGQAYLDPYGFIAGGLYDDHKGGVGNGNEKGVSMARDEDSYVGFNDIDFGDFGSDTITMPIFTLNSDEYQIGIWEGRPGDAGSELIDTLTYSKEMIWNVYQEETWKLPRRIKGITSIYFTATVKFHIKGFSFKRLDKAYETLSALDNTRVYGDTFTVEKDAVTGIGNNVTLEYEGLDFGENGTDEIIICGHTPLANNSIHLHFNDAKGDHEELLEFEGSEDYVERSFKLPVIRGAKKIGLVFLPGCNFDLKWFRFKRSE